MKIKNYKCKCGKDDFQFIKRDYHAGIYCTFCGTFLKWASKDEKQLFEMNRLFETINHTDESDAEFMCKAMSKTVNKSIADNNFIGGF